MNISHIDEVEVKLYAFLIWTPDGGGWSVSLCSSFFSGASPQVKIELEDV